MMFCSLNRRTVQCDWQSNVHVQNMWGLLALLITVARAWDNGAALTPPMGFANWNVFGCNYTDALFREMADAIVETGLGAKGYEYMLVQECIVEKGDRDPVTGVVRPNLAMFPHGLADLAAYFHSKGLKAGVYTDVKSVTCAGYEGSGPGPNTTSHWKLDALTYAQWGFDMIEADFCNSAGSNASAYELYKEARDAIAEATAATGRIVAFYACNWGVEKPWEWAPEVANLFRNTGDICSPGSISFSRILSNFDQTVSHSSTPPSAPGLPGTGCVLPPRPARATRKTTPCAPNPKNTVIRQPPPPPFLLFPSSLPPPPLSPSFPVLFPPARVDAWNDPDMLGVGMNGITDTEGRSQFSLWCILAAPLFLGTDVRVATPFTLATIGNVEAIAIDQDALGIQGFAVGSGGAPAPTPYNGGLLANLTPCASPPPPGGAWTLDGEGRLHNGAPGVGCVTVFECNTAPGSPIGLWGDCEPNQCGNQLWTLRADGALVSREQGAGATSCLTAGSPDTTLTLAPCATPLGPWQAWALGAGGALSLPRAPSAPCLAVPAPPAVSLYAKPLMGGDLGLAVLNRGEAGVGGQVVDLGALGFAPAQRVTVRDIWEGTTSAPVQGSFTTRAVGSHETLLLRIKLAA